MYGSQHGHAGGGEAGVEPRQQTTRWCPSWRGVERYLKMRVPSSVWLPRYKSKFLAGDLVAGCTVGVMVVPQALAYAAIADLPYQYGLFAALMGVFVYTFLGTSKDVTVGPTAVMSLLVAVQAQGSPVRAVTLSFMAGVIQLVLGLLHIGAVMDFITPGTLSGFISAAAITIGIGQLKHIFGLHGIRRPVIEAVPDLIHNIGHTQLGDLLLGLACVVVILCLKLVQKRWGGSNRVAFVLGTARNGIVVVLSGLLAFCVHAASPGATLSQPFAIIGPLPAGLPKPDLPEPHMDLWLPAVLVAFIGFLESISIAKAFGRRNGYSVDTCQELVALGAANVVGSFLQSYPVTGSFSRTSVNAQSGVSTPAAGVLTGTIVMLALLLLTPAFYYVPKASLAAVIITAVATMVEYKEPFIMWRRDRMDLLCLAVSFVGCLCVSIAAGVLAAVALSLVVTLYHVARPRWTTLRLLRGDEWVDVGLHKEGTLATPKDSVMVFRYEGALTGPSCEHFREALATAERRLLDEERRAAAAAATFLLSPATGNASELAAGGVGASLDELTFVARVCLPLPHSVRRLLVTDGRYRSGWAARASVVGTPQRQRPGQGRTGSSGPLLSTAAAGGQGPASPPRYIRGLVLDMQCISRVDGAGATALADVVQDYVLRRPFSVQVQLCGLTYRVRDTLRACEVVPGALSSTSVHHNVQDAVRAATRLAQRRASEAQGRSNSTSNERAVGGSAGAGAGAGTGGAGAAAGASVASGVVGGSGSVNHTRQHRGSMRDAEVGRARIQSAS